MSKTVQFVINNCFILILNEFRLKFSQSNLISLDRIDILFIIIFFPIFSYAGGGAVLLLPFYTIRATIFEKVLMPLLPPSFVGRAGKTLNPRQEHLSAANK